MIKKRVNEYEIRGDIVIGETAKGETFIFDLEDLEKVEKHNWFINNGYVGTNVKGTQGRSQQRLNLHQLILGKKKGYVTDHINRDKSDNRKNNLRYATYSQNAMNKGVLSNSISQAKGVYNENGKWRVNLWINYRKIYIGYFNTKEEAINARTEAEKKYFGEFA